MQDEMMSDGGRGPVMCVETLRRDERGAASIEYSLIAGLIAIAMLTGLTLASGTLIAVWNNIATSYPGA